MRGYIDFKKEQLLTLSLSKLQNGRDWKGPLEIIRVQSHLGSVTYSQRSKTVSKQLLSISEDGDSTTYLGHACQDSVILVPKKYFFTFRGNLLCLGLHPLPLVLALGTTEKKPNSGLSASFLQVFILIEKIPLTLLQSEQSQLSQPFLIKEMLQTPQQLWWASWAFSSISISLLY